MILLFEFEKINVQISFIILTKCGSNAIKIVIKFCDYSEDIIRIKKNIFQYYTKVNVEIDIYNLDLSCIWHKSSGVHT